MQGFDGENLVERLGDGKTVFYCMIMFLDLEMEMCEYSEVVH